MIERLDGEHIAIRKGRMSDLDAMWHNVWSDHSIEKNVLWKVVETREEAEERLRGSLEFQSRVNAFFVVIKDTDEAVGFAAVREIPAESSGDTADGEALHSGIYEDAGLGIAAAYQGRGYGKEILRLLMKLVFEELGGKKFLYGCFTENVRSAALCKSQGFHYVFSKPGVRKWDGYNYVSDYYELTVEEYFAL